MNWRLTGTPSQITLAKLGMSMIKFPLDRLKTPPTGDPELGWRDLNVRSHEDHEPVATPISGTSTLGHEHSDEDEYEPLMGSIDGRRFTLGVFYPYSARIYIDSTLEKLPDLAISVMSAELGHAVDEFLPLTEGQRNAIIEEVGGKIGSDTWWEKSDYSAEYFSLVGETFMILFTKAYTDIQFGNTTDFVFEGENTTAEEIRKIIGVERTDSFRFVRYGKSLVAHKPTHYPAKTNGVWTADMAGLRQCKICARR